ncbi:carboxypeptidase regulatory-like domain-containing protein [Archangium gephyra]|nr:carboxypeptidase regulatory-like domain-containing protein [Archangium gephyra]
MKNATWMWSLGAALLLTACPDPDTDPNPGGGSTITVTGKVLDENGRPVKHASILIPGNGRQAAALDSTGAFSIEGVTAPYDVIVVQREIRTATVYKGLSRRDLTLPYITNVEIRDDDYRTARLEGTVTGGSTPYDVSSPKVDFVSAASSGTAFADPDGTYSGEVNWNGPDSITGTLYAIQMESSAPFTPPSSYLGFGRRDNVTLSNDTTSSALDITMNSVTDSHLGGSVTVPNGYALSTIGVTLVPEPNASIDLFYAPELGGTFNYVVPQIPQSTFTVQASASFENPADPFNTASSMLYKKGLTAGTSNAALVLQEAARPSQPADNATEVTRATEFSWTAFTGGIHQFHIQEMDTAPDTSSYSVYIFTSGTQTTLPDLSVFDMSLPANATFTWNVQSIAPVASMDALSELALTNPMLGTTDFALSISEKRTFTTSAAP